MDLPVLAGALSTVIFAASMLPMLAKAARTKDLGSYSLGNIGLINLGNVIHTPYVLSLPAGPVWALHTFYLLSSAFMLLWCVRYRPGRGRARSEAARSEAARSDAARSETSLVGTPAG